MRIGLGDVSLWFDVSGPSVVPQGDTAERPVLVAVHGGPGLDHMTVKSALGPLAEDFQVLYFDLRGHGRSDHSSAKFWNVRTWADDLRRLCDALGLRQPVVLGRVQPRLLPALQRHTRLGRGIRPVPGSDDQEPGRQLALQSRVPALRSLERDRRRPVPRAGLHRRRRPSLPASRSRGTSQPAAGGNDPPGSPARCAPHHLPRPPGPRLPGGQQISSPRSRGRGFRWLLRRRAGWRSRAGGRSGRAWS